MNSRFIPVALAASAISLAACGGGTGDNGGASPSPITYTGTVTAAGSTALQPLVSAAKDAFEAKNSGATITVNGGGSGTGLSQVAQGSVDIGDSDIPVTSVATITPGLLVDHQVAVVAFSIIVNPGVQITSLTQAQAQQVISGQVTNWKDVGGNDQKIAVILRPASSGTHKVFNKIVMGGVADIATPAATQDATGAVVTAVAQTPGAVSYVSLSGIKDASVKKVQYNGVEATAANVIAGTYKIWSHEHMYTKGVATGIVDGFIKYILSSEFQNSDAFTSLGFISTTKVTGTSGADG